MESLSCSLLFFVVVCLCGPILCAPNKRNVGTFGINGNCSFDQNLCNWVNARSGDNFDWTLQRGETASSNTGPYKDVSGNGRYVYIESSHPRKKGQTASLISGPYIGVLCMQFYYHMKGSHIGDLQIYMSERGPIGQTFIWGKYGRQGPFWRKDNVTVYGFAYDVLIVARVGGGYEGDIALDQITFSPGTCYPDEDPEELLKRRLGSEGKETNTTKGSCDFDTDLCGWSNDNMDDVFDWQALAGPTGTRGTGPKKDHGGKDGGQYMFIESSSPRRQGDRARLLSPQLCGNMCLRFYYHMFGNGMGTLSVIRKEGISDKGDRLWYAQGNRGTDWHRGIVEMNSDQDCYQIIIEGIVGSSYTSDIAIDDLYVQKGSCCDMKSEKNRLDKTGNCNFEKSFCGWTNLKIDDFDWSLGKGRTPSDHTGPSRGFGSPDGYAFIEASEPRFVGDTAIMASGYLLGSMCMRFRYHMYGEDIGSLSVFRNGDGVMQQLLWQQDGNQGDTWHDAELFIDCNITKYLVEIEASVGGWRGDIAVDNIKFTPGACPPKPVIIQNINYTTAAPVISQLPEFNGFCSFDKGFCSWENDIDDYFDFERKKGPTATQNTGPQADFSGDGYYIYLEASNRRPGEFARLVSGSLKNSMCLKFFYHMHGEGVGDLRVELRESETFIWNTTWSVSGDQGGFWQLASVTITGYDYVLGITAVRGRNFIGDIAIDSIALTEGACLGDEFAVGAAQSAKLVDCSFDKGRMCEWENEKDDDFDWRINKGSTPTGGTGPRSDRSGNGYYIYIETSSPRMKGNVARLSMEVALDVCMRFYYHMYGADIGSLAIHIKESKTDSRRGADLWSAKGDQGNLWKDASVSITSNTKKTYWIVFEGTRGKSFRGDIAIDEITFTPGLCRGQKRQRRHRRQR